MPKKGWLKKSKRNSAILLLNFSFVVRSGSIFHTIGELATELNAVLVVMGTHGITGMQKFLGSWALKVIASSKAPFIVVQESPKSEAMKNIILPINYKRETKECVTWTHFFSRKFGTKFHLFRAKYSDSNFRKGLDSNMFFITKYFTSKGIRFESQMSVGEEDFGKETIQYAKKCGCRCHYADDHPRYRIYRLCNGCPGTIYYRQQRKNSGYLHQSEAGKNWRRIQCQRRMIQ